MIANPQDCVGPAAAAPFFMQNWTEEEMEKQINIPKHDDVKIVNDAENHAIVGTVRVQANGILWKPKGQRAASHGSR